MQKIVNVMTKMMCALCMYIAIGHIGFEAALIHHEFIDYGLIHTLFVSNKGIILIGKYIQ